MKKFDLLVNDHLDAITEEDLLAAIDTLPPWRREKALRFKHLQGRKECTYAYLLLCQALRDIYGITEQPAFSIGVHGKPRLVLTPEPPAFSSPDVHFNLSHCRQAVACVVASCEVGIDIESIGRYKEPLARHVLNDQELASVQQAADPQLAFTRYWTQKEAIVKLTGRGIDDDLRNLLLIYNNVSLHTEEHPDKGYVLTVATYAPKGE
ncbi:MAG: 4'-phosphopantetheinyl transferase superfamily protein [Bacteroidaceae bacterium]|nr:4'-phosphopantetheinyl transferase superfamily protein [Bacteroidaceae bacterium]